MDAFHLSDEAIGDIDAIWFYLLKRAGLEIADRVVGELFEAFHKLAHVPGSGHRRPDLTAKPILFYAVYSYLIVYQPSSRPLQILGVLHAKRNVRRFLPSRL